MKITRFLSGLQIGFSIIYLLGAFIAMDWFWIKFIPQLEPGYRILLCFPILLVVAFSTIFALNEKASKDE